MTWPFLISGPAGGREVACPPLIEATVVILASFALAARTPRPRRARTPVPGTRSTLGARRRQHGLTKGQRIAGTNILDAARG
jgi:hypothetical protein